MRMHPIPPLPLSRYPRLRTLLRGWPWGIRHLLGVLCLGVGIGSGLVWASSFELNLRMDHALHPSAAHSSPAESAPLNTVRDDTGQLAFARSLPGMAQPEEKPSLFAYKFNFALHGAQEIVQFVLRALWLACALFLLAYVVREWVRVLLVRLRREHHPISIEQAQWPVVSILVLPKGDGTTQAHRLEQLRTLPFDYPPERIHLVVAYPADETEVRAAVYELGKALPERVHALAIKSGEEASTATLLPYALRKSVGSALVVFDQSLPIARSWLKQAVSPLFDPSVGIVLNRVVPGQAHNALATRLVALADHADVRLATQEDAIDLLLSGKARIRTLRRAAYKHIEQKASELTPDGASVVLELVRIGWQAELLGDMHKELHLSRDTIRTPRLHPAIILQALRLSSLAFARHVPRGARVQGRAVFFAAAQALVWLISLMCGLILYAMGDMLWGGIAISLCAATSFDPLGHPRPAFSVAAAARMAGLREEIRLLPLACISFFDRMLEGLHVSLRYRRQRPPQAKRSSDATQLGKETASS